MWSVVWNNGCGPALIQMLYFTQAESNAEIVTNPQFSSVIVCFSELISAELSSASESIQPGLINLGQSKYSYSIQLMWSMALNRA